VEQPIRHWPGLGKARADRSTAVAFLKTTMKSAFMWIEGLFDWAFGSKWNPFYCLGALGYYYFWVVAISGVYVYIFFDTGVPKSYQSIEYMTHDQWYLAGIMRSVHRYASDAMVVVVLMHLCREFAFDRYRGGRWFSWVTGVSTLWLVFSAGVTGYWLVWDKLAQYIAIVTTEWLDWLPIFGEPIARNFIAPSHFDGRFFSLLVFMHIAIPLFLLFVMWLHLQRINYAKTNLARGLAIGTTLMLLVLSLIKPAVSHEFANLSEVPATLKLDWFYLWAYPMIDHLGAGFMWGFAGIGTALLVIIPWLPPKKRQQVAVVDLENCNGCTRCVADCPFCAVNMQPRTDGAPFAEEAAVDPDMCVSCGICVGACPTSMPFRRAGSLQAGIELPDLTVAALRDQVDTAARALGGRDRVMVFGCNHGCDPSKLDLDNVVGIRLRCSGMLPPAFIDYVLSRDLADGVVVTGCRKGECHHRIGNDWVDDRFARIRDPRLRRRVPGERLLKIWAARTDRQRLRKAVGEFKAGLSVLPEPDAPGPNPTTVEHGGKADAHHVKMVAQ
jgi:quinol-cytochrome oxidoreductase complex cytochrome b subunit/coenzyme F420-reducing hydrogenase delta subunit